MMNFFPLGYVASIHGILPSCDASDDNFNTARSCIKTLIYLHFQLEPNWMMFLINVLCAFIFMDSFHVNYRNTSMNLDFGTWL